jgi:GntR family transcriptional regulator, transcriptional repressor for pyruvate dehydrogenase complex
VEDDASSEAERHTAADPWLAELRVPKASDVLAGRLRHRILSGELAPGMSLPIERDLVARSGLSRTTVREALRILELEGVVQTRPGRKGGTVVRRPHPGPVAHSLDVFIRGSRLRLASLLEVREAVEPSCAALAARRRTDAELAELERFDAALEAAFNNVRAYLVANVDWHVALARMSHNELLAGFMEAMASAIFEGTDVADFNSDEIRRDALHAHRRIQEAVRDQDPGAARRRMARHLQAYEVAVMGVKHPDEVPLE